MRPLDTRLAPYEVFFPLAALGTIVDLGLFLLTLDGRWSPPAGLGAVDWHAHEMLFGHFPAAFAGVMLTALPRWTKGPSMAPVGVVGLAVSFLAARLAFALAPMPVLPWVSPLAIATLAIYAGGRIVAAGDRRDLGLVGLLGLLALADAFFLLGLGEGDVGFALRLGFAAAALVAMVMGGRIAPALTRHLAAMRGRPEAPTPPRGFERLVFAVSVPALALWVFAPLARPTAALLAVAALLHLGRLATWRGWSAIDRPPFLALHLGYAFLPAGLAALALAALRDDVVLADIGVHAWGTGTFGLMCAAIMTSVVRRYSGRALTVSRLADAIVGLLLLAAGLRLAAGLAGLSIGLVHASAGAWIAAYGVLLMLTRRDRRLPAGAGVSSEAADFEEENGGPGRTRTCNQSVMSGRL